MCHAGRVAGPLIRLLGRPTLERPEGHPHQLRSRKSWALLAYLLLTETSPTRSQLAGLLFTEAQDPLRALRWSLAELRRALGEGAELDGDPVRLTLPPDAVVDVEVLVNEPWARAVEVASLGRELLDGFAFRGAPAFESWLLAERRRFAGAAESVLHEAAVGLLARGAHDRARGFAVRAAELSPMDENHQALLIRLYRLCGDDRAAEAQYDAWRSLLAAELGVPPGGVVEAAMRARRPDRTTADTAITTPAVDAAIEAGVGAIAAGARETGVASLRDAVRLADATRSTPLRIHARQMLAEALIHSLRGLDEEGLAHLHAADDLAQGSGDRTGAAQARAELGYVDFLRARYGRAEQWLNGAVAVGADSPATMAKAAAYLGSVHSDRADYPEAVTHLERAQTLARLAEDPRREAYALCMKGRLELLCGRLEESERDLTTAIKLAEREHWLWFLPWPQSFLGGVHRARHDPGRAAEILQQAFARACQLGDPCWEGSASRELALVADATGDTERAFETLRDARIRSNRLADPYVWLDVYILDALCELGRRHRHPQTRRWVETMRDLASRTGMREFTVRALVHSAALGHDGDGAAAGLLAAEIDNPELQRLVHGE